MIIALGVMLITSLLLVGAFTVANGDIQLSHTDATQKQAYYAALAGIQEYEYKLQNNPDYWETCEKPKSTVPEESSERYEVIPLAASQEPKGTLCSTSNPFGTMIESKGSQANTFRVESTGYSGTTKRAIVATFKVVGFLNYIYYTNFETEDPGLYQAPEGCENEYYKSWSKNPKKPNCQAIEFTDGDSIEGPMHTNDTTLVNGAASFGRKGQSPPDLVEMNGGTYGANSGCKSAATYYTATKCYITTGPTLIPPESDISLGSYVESADEFTGVTHIDLKGTTMTVENAGISGGKETIALPANGLIYVRSGGESHPCEYSYEPLESDESKETTKEVNCGTVYVEGHYSSSLTIGAENDVVIEGNIYPTGVTPSEAPTGAGTTTLGLIASDYVRVYHSCTSGYTSGNLENPWIYAAILSTSHSFAVDNYNCGNEVGKLHVYGAIGQDYRGIVGSGSHGYIKDYKYDNRLAVDEPPYFLSPLKAGWKVSRETSPKEG